MAKPNGAVIYRGPSQLDGKPIVVIATGFAKSSDNEKTGGGLIQTWILREDMSPVVATQTGDDASICGDCPHRGTATGAANVGRSCYVEVFKAPTSVWKTYKRGGYPQFAGHSIANLFAGRGVRLGSYGDPAAVPAHVWAGVLDRHAFHTGYTHQWRAFPELAQWCMASADSASDRAAAKLLGFRTFRVRTLAQALELGEVVCPASKEAGFKTTCDTCRACGGLTSKARADIVIAAHGAMSKVNAFAAQIAA